MRENTVQGNIKIPFHSRIIHFDLYYLIQLKVKPYTMVWIRKIYYFTAEYNLK